MKALERIKEIQKMCDVCFLAEIKKCIHKKPIKFKFKGIGHLLKMSKEKS